MFLPSPAAPSSDSRRVAHFWRRRGDLAATVNFSDSGDCGGAGRQSDTRGHIQRHHQHRFDRICAGSGRLAHRRHVVLGGPVDRSGRIGGRWGVRQQRRGTDLATHRRGRRSSAGDGGATGGRREPRDFRCHCRRGDVVHRLRRTLRPVSRQLRRSGRPVTMGRTRPASASAFRSPSDGARCARSPVRHSGRRPLYRRSGACAMAPHGVEVRPQVRFAWQGR